MPRGIAGVIPWEPTCSFMVDYLHTGKYLDQSWASSMYEGNYYVIGDIAKNAPDVAQALTDAFMEATLYIRYHPDEVVKWLQVDPMLKHFPEALLTQQQATYNNLYKPTAAYPFPRFWATENARISRISLQEQDRHALADRPRLLRCMGSALHGRDVQEARLESSGDAAVDSEKLARENRLATVSDLLQRVDDEKGAAMAREG